MMPPSLIRMPRANTQEEPILYSESCPLKVLPMKTRLEKLGYDLDPDKCERIVSSNEDSGCGKL